MSVKLIMEVVHKHVWIFLNPSHVLVYLAMYWIPMERGAMVMFFDLNIGVYLPM